MNHNGAKNGGGYWGKREEAKKASRKGRRAIDKKYEEDFCVVCGAVLDWEHQNIGTDNKGQPYHWYCRNEVDSND